MVTSLNDTVPGGDVAERAAVGPIAADASRRYRPKLAVGVLIRNKLLRQGLDAILGRISWVSVTMAAVTVNDRTGMCAAQQLVESGVDVVVTTAAERILLPPALDPEPARRYRILVLLPDEEFRDADLVTLSWSDGALLQGELSVELLDDALYRLSIGEMPLSRQLAHQLVARAARGTGQQVRSVALTPRENQTLVLLANGMSNKEIARALGVSSHGAKRLVGSILVKLGAPNRTAAVVNAIKAGIIDSP